MYFFLVLSLSLLLWFLRLLDLDIVFCRTWYPLTCPKLYNPVQSLLLSKDQKQNWQGMRTVGQLRKDKNIKLQQKSDSLYKVTRSWIYHKRLSCPFSGTLEWLCMHQINIVFVNKF